MTATGADLAVDRQEIVDTAVRYATALDNRDWALLRTCFTDDAVAEYGALGPSAGYAAIEATCRAALMPLDASQHLISNHVVEVDGDEATLASYVQAQHVRVAAPGGPNRIVAGRYDDRLTRTAAGWRIRHRRLTVIWTEGNPAVMNRDQQR